MAKRHRPLTVVNSPKNKGEILTKKTEAQFILCFKYPLQKGFTFAELGVQEIRAFQGFLDKVSNMSVQQVDTTFARPPDKNDIYNGLQVYHYAISNEFRIHVVIENGRYKLIRLDPFHRYHK